VEFHRERYTVHRVALGEVGRSQPQNQRSRVCAADNQLLVSALCRNFCVVVQRVGVSCYCHKCAHLIVVEGVRFIELVFLILVLCLALCFVRALILDVGLDTFAHCRAHSPFVNFREDQFAANALAFTRLIHGSVPIALDHRFVTRCATSVAFVCLFHRPGKYIFSWLIGVFVKLHFNFANSKF
jgi:hypothetical protein